MSEKKTTKSGSAAPVIEFQPRDFELLRGLFESRLMTQEQATRLYFDGKTEAAKKRLQKLKALRLIAERERRVYHPAILYLTKRGFDCLATHGKLSDYPRLAWHQLEKRAQVSELTLGHEIDVMQVKATLAVALRATGRFAPQAALPLPSFRPGQCCTSSRRASPARQGTMAAVIWW